MSHLTAHEQAPSPSLPGTSSQDTTMAHITPDVAVAIAAREHTTLLTLPPQLVILSPVSSASPTDVTFSSSPKLPFVGRDDSLQKAAKVLVANIVITIHSDFNARGNLALVVAGHMPAGHMPGSGKTAFAENLPRYIRPALVRIGRDPEKLVVVHVRFSEHLDSLFDLWRGHILQQPAMVELGGRISEGMHVADLVAETSKYLVERNLVLFLHLDEFIPHSPRIQEVFLRSEKSREDIRRKWLTCIDIFRYIWYQTLIDLQHGRNIMLVITGKCADYDSIGEYCQGGGCPPSRVHKFSLELLSEEHVKEIMQQMMVKQSDDELISVADVLTTLLVPPDDGSAKEHAVDMVAKRIHALSGGVPSFIEALLYSILETANTMTGNGLFAARSFAIQMKLADIISILSFPKVTKFDRVVTVVTAVKNVIRNSVNSIRDEELLQQYIHLHKFFAAASAPVEADDSYTSAFDSSRRWLDAAQFWGMYHSYHQTTSAYHKGQIIFVMPELANLGVTECCNELNERVCKVLSATMATSGTAGESFVHSVKNAMTMDRWLLALNNGQDSLMEQMMQNHFQETGVFAKRRSKKYLDEVMRSSNLCNHLPSLGKESGQVQVLAQYLDSLERPMFEVYMLGPTSPCADIIVRHMETWIHVVVKDDVGADIGALKQVSKICKNVIQHCDSSKPGSRHIIVLAISDGDAQPVLSAVGDQLLAVVDDKDRVTGDHAAAVKQAIAHTFGTQLVNGEQIYATRQEVSFRIPIEVNGFQLQKKRPRSEMDQLSVEGMTQWRDEEVKAMLDAILEVTLQHNMQAVGLTAEESKRWSEHGLLGHFLMENGVIGARK